MVKALKPGGRLVFVEFRLEDPKVPIKLVHKMSEKQVLKEMRAAPAEARQDGGHVCRGSTSSSSRRRPRSQASGGRQPPDWAGLGADARSPLTSACRGRRRGSRRWS